MSHQSYRLGTKNAHSINQIIQTTITIFLQTITLRISMNKFSLRKNYNQSRPKNLIIQDVGLHDKIKSKQITLRTGNFFNNIINTQKVDNLKKN